MPLRKLKARWISYSKRNNWIWVSYKQLGLSFGGNCYIADAINPNILMSKSNNSYRIIFSRINKYWDGSGVISSANNNEPQITYSRTK